MDQCVASAGVETARSGCRQLPHRRARHVAANSGPDVATNLVDLAVVNVIAGDHRTGAEHLPAGAGHAGAGRDRRVRRGRDLDLPRYRRTGTAPVCSLPQAAADGARVVDGPPRPDVATPAGRGSGCRPRQLYRERAEPDHAASAGRARPGRTRKTPGQPRIQRAGRDVTGTGPAGGAAQAARGDALTVADGPGADGRRRQAACWHSGRSGPASPAGVGHAALLAASDQVATAG